MIEYCEICQSDSCKCAEDEIVVTRPPRLHKPYKERASFRKRPQFKESEIPTLLETREALAEMTERGIRHAE